mmetsp:Transcript_5583/g.11074  ORF Transcript_5583/g.11074 Transcript_5583/m.11074 type:complete len:226 (+) Transcript_5583:47-724(+)
MAAWPSSSLICTLRKECSSERFLYHMYPPKAPAPIKAAPRRVTVTMTPTGFLALLDEPPSLDPLSVPPPRPEVPESPVSSDPVDSQCWSCTPAHSMTSLRAALASMVMSVEYFAAHSSMVSYWISHVALETRPRALMQPSLALHSPRRPVQRASMQRFWMRALDFLKPAAIFAVRFSLPGAAPPPHAQQAWLAYNPPVPLQSWLSHETLMVLTGGCAGSRHTCLA